MSEVVQGILVGHGRMAEGLLDAVEKIAGFRDGLVALNNEAYTIESLERDLANLACDRPTVIFVDLPSGSCAYAARRMQRGRNHVAVVCGVNLPILLDFVFNRTRPLPEIVERLRSQAGITIDPQTNVDRSVSDR